MGGPAPWSHLADEDRVLDPVWVRERCMLLDPPLGVPTALVDARPAAVLVALFPEDGETHLVLMKRPDSAPSHKGEISFPGGNRSSNDSNLSETALREAHEEVGIRPETVEVLAELPTIGTVKGAFAITPFVGFIAERPALLPDPREVDKVFTVALSELLHPETWHSERWDLWGEEFDMSFYLLENETVWGATARILTGLLVSLTEF
ncbi:MAG: CoA pyrophosphatase [Acidimicrobiia bacterium]|nr:CoA pyrophosphatase [Acidimicrobiia bacterium]